MPTRKSGRTRKANKKYTVDAFEGLDILGSDSETEAEAHVEDDFADDGDSAFENLADAVDSPEGDDSSVAEDTGASDRSDVATPVEENEDAMAVDDPEEAVKAMQGQPLKKSRRHGSSRIKSMSDTQDVRFRGMPDPTTHAGKDILFSHLFGTGTEEIVNMARSRDKWASDPILPVRQVNERGSGGMCHSFSHTEEQRTMEATVGWDWYYDHGGKDRLTKRQKIRQLNHDEGHTYLPQSTKGSQSFLIGPYGDQNLCTLEIGKVFNLEKAWSYTNGPPKEADGKGTSRKGRREGWILNVGRKIKCMDWAPNQDGSIQLLALSTSSTTQISPQTNSQKHGVPLKAPAFTPAPPTSASIQIWAFYASTETGREGSLDLKRDPKLQMVICSEWGDVKQLKWCSTPREPRDADSKGKVALGLLAGLWGDGRVKVLDLEIDTDLNLPTRYGKPHLLASFRRLTI